MSNFIVEINKQIAQIIINRPQAMNSLSQEADIEFCQILDDLGNNQDVRAVVIKGAGEKAFCAGADLKERQRMNANEKWIQTRHLQKVLEKIEDCPVPVIAAIRGYCLGGGLELALACDMRIASETAIFYFPEMTLGAFPGSGGPVRLCRIISPTYAKEILMTAKKIGAQEAYKVGLLNGVTEDSKLEEEVERICNEILKSTRIGVESVKRIINSIQNHDIKNSFELSNALRQSLESTKEYIEGIDRHFQNKRK